jgi:prophage maintenance system killer protein
MSGGDVSINERRRCLDMGGAARRRARHPCPSTPPLTAPDAADLAACYAFGIAKNHAFVDGNKRTAWVVARLFLSLNGHRMTFAPQDAVLTVEAMAAGRLDEAQRAEWFRTRPP